MATSKLMADKIAIGKGLNGVSLNDLPDIFATYGFWGGSGVTDYPTGVDPSGAVLITFPASGSTTQLQLFIKGTSLYVRQKSYTNTWSTWAQI